MRALIGVSLFIISCRLCAYEFDLSFSQSKKRYGALGSQKTRVIKTLQASTADSYDFGKWLITPTITLINPDYSEYYLRTEAGAEFSLDHLVDPSSVEYFLNVDTTFYSSIGDFTLSLFSHIGTSPFHRKGIGLNYRLKFMQGRGSFFVKSVYYNQKMPQDYFIDVNFANRLRPLDVTLYSVESGAEFALTEQLKTLLTLEVGEKKRERPRHYGISSKWAYAFTDSLFWHTDIRYLAEQQGEKLLNERGYFNYLAFGNRLNWEVTFDVLLSIGYVFTREREEDPRIGSELQVGSDTYYLGLEYDFTWGKVIGQFDYTVTNTDEELINSHLKIVKEL